MTMNNSWFQKLLLLLVIVGGINWGIYGIWGFDLVGWVLGGSLGWLARTVFVRRCSPRRRRRTAAPSPAARDRACRAKTASARLGKRGFVLHFIPAVPRRRRGGHGCRRSAPAPRTGTS